jgi:hypothetical protein
MEYITGVSLYDYLCRKGRLLGKDERPKFKQEQLNTNMDIMYMYIIFVAYLPHDKVKHLHTHTQCGVARLF